MPFWIVLVACWHITQDQHLSKDTSCPATTQDDQGAVIYADDGTSVVVKGEYYIDGGWGMCLDGRAPGISNRKSSDIWKTTIDCRGQGPMNRELKANDLNGSCPLEPKYDIHYRSDLWQVHIYCPAPSAQS